MEIAFVLQMVTVISPSQRETQSGNPVGVGEGYIQPQKGNVRSPDTPVLRRLQSALVGERDKLQGLNSNGERSDVHTKFP